MLARCWVRSSLGTLDARVQDRIIAGTRGSLTGGELAGGFALPRLTKLCSTSPAGRRRGTPQQASIADRV
jgi:hypothetical protein